MKTAWLAAGVVMVAGLVAYYVALQFIAGHVLFYASYGIPALGAAVAAFLAPRHKFNVGAATVILAIVVIGAGSYLAGRLGFGDSIGVQGTVVAMTLAIPFVAISSVCGALLGQWASKGRANA